MLDLRRSQMDCHRDTCCQQRFRPVEFPLEHRVCFDARHRVFYTLTVVIDPGVFTATMDLVNTCPACRMYLVSTP